jgi:hypothetical protein
VGSTSTSLSWAWRAEPPRTTPPPPGPALGVVVSKVLSRRSDGRCKPAMSPHSPGWRTSVKTIRGAPVVPQCGTPIRYGGTPGPTESRDHDNDEPNRYGRPMASPILLCTDGSDEALGALSAGLDLLGPEYEFVLVTVADAPDEGSMAGPVMPDPNCLSRSTTTKLPKLAKQPNLRLERRKASSHSLAPRFMSFAVTLAQPSVNLQLNCPLGQS